MGRFCEVVGAFATDDDEAVARVLRALSVITGKRSPA
jgi:hypothetical protein